MVRHIVERAIALSTDFNAAMTRDSRESCDRPDFVVIDVETACSCVSSICQVGIVGFRAGCEVFAWETLLDPRDQFHAMNTRIHGIAAHHVVGQPTFADVHAVIDRHLTGTITVAHSLFDKAALAAACRMHALAEIETIWLDSVRVAKRAWPDLPNHKLGGLARYLNVRHRHHDALSDARAAGWVILRAIEHTGLSLADWMAPTRPSGPAPRAAPIGPLAGERVVIVGEPRDGQLAHAVAAAGGIIRTSVGSTTTLVVIAGDTRFEKWLRSDPQVRRAQLAKAGGQGIAIVTEESLRQMLVPASSG